MLDISLLYWLEQRWSVHKHFPVVHPLRTKPRDTEKETQTHSQSCTHSWFLQKKKSKYKWKYKLSHLDEAFIVFPFTVACVCLKGWIDSVRALSSMWLSWSWTCSRAFIFTFWSRTQKKRKKNTVSEYLFIARLWFLYLLMWWWLTWACFSHCFKSSACKLLCPPAAKRNTSFNVNNFIHYKTNVSWKRKHLTI